MKIAMYTLRVVISLPEKARIVTGPAKSTSIEPQWRKAPARADTRVRGYDYTSS